MKLFSMLLALLVLVACDKQVTDPSGIYILDKGYESYTLVIRPDRHYSLKVLDPGGKISLDIQGTWEREAESDQFSLSGVIWENSRARAGAGIWMIKFEGFRGEKICMEAEGISCFLRRPEG